MLIALIFGWVIAGLLAIILFLFHRRQFFQLFVKGLSLQNFSQFWQKVIYVCTLLGVMIGIVSLTLTLSVLWQIYPLK